MNEWLGFPPYEDYYALKIYTKLPLNAAFLMVNTTLNRAGLYARTYGCDDCPFELLYPLESGTEHALIVDTNIKVLRVMRFHNKQYINKNSIVDLFCETIPLFGEYGVYRLDVGQCDIKTIVSPVNTYLPLLFVALLLLTAFIFYAFVKFILKNIKCFPADRLYLKFLRDGIQSLHFFKGLLLLLIIFVTTGAGGYPVIKRLGLSFADCLYFAYSWSIGVSIPSNVDNALVKHSKPAIICDVYKKAFYLVLLGVLIDSTAPILSSDYVLWCPLQKLGVAYFTAVTTYTLTVKKIEIISKNIFYKAVGDFMSLLWCWIISGLLISIMVAVIHVLNSINCQIELKDTYKVIYASETCDSYQMNTMNLILMGERRSMVPINDYYAFTSGIMGFLSTILSTMMGLKAGTVYLRHQSQLDRLKLWTIWATIFKIGGLILLGVTRHLDFNLGPISWITLIAAMAMYWYSFVYVMTDIWKVNNTTITSTGIASLVIFSGHLLFSNSWPFRINPELNNHFFYLMQNVVTVSWWSCVGVMFVKNNIPFTI